MSGNLHGWVLKVPCRSIQANRHTGGINTNWVRPPRPCTFPKVPVDKTRVSQIQCTPLLLNLSDCLSACRVPAPRRPPLTLTSFNSTIQFDQDYVVGFACYWYSKFLWYLDVSVVPWLSNWFLSNRRDSSRSVDVMHVCKLFRFWSRTNSLRLSGSTGWLLYKFVSFTYHQ